MRLPLKSTCSAFPGLGAGLPSCSSLRVPTWSCPDHSWSLEGHMDIKILFSNYSHQRVSNHTKTSQLSKAESSSSSDLWCLFLQVPTTSVLLCQLRIAGLFQLEKLSRIIRSNPSHSTAQATTDPCPQVPHARGF